MQTTTQPVAQTAQTGAQVGARTDARPPVRLIKTIDNITKDGLTELGEGYALTDDMEKAQAIIIRSSSMHEMELPRGVQAVARAGAGFNNIPIVRFAREGVVVFNTPGANSNAVKELMVCMFMLASRDVLGGIAWVREHADDPDVYNAAERAKKAFVGQEIMGRTVGVIGLGNVGSKVANALVGLGMRVYGYDPYIAVENAWQLSGSVVRVNDLDELCRACDYITIHVPSDPTTVGMIGPEQIGEMRDGVIFFNYSRETLVQEQAMAQALESGKVRLYVTDFATPGVMRMPNIIVTPHAGAGTGEAEANCARMALAELKGYLERGCIKNSVNYPDIDLGPCRGASRLVTLHANVPNMIGQITAVLAGRNVNIQRMANDALGNNAVTLFDTDEPIDDEVARRLEAIEGMWRVRVVR